MATIDLPDPDEPFNGMSGHAEYMEVPNSRKTAEAVARIRLTLKELPLPPQAMNAVSVVLMYTMIGLGDNEIAVATGMSMDQIVRIRRGEAYEKMHANVITSVLDEDSDDVRAILAASAKKSARRVAELVDSIDEQVALSASKDVLDRNGHRPADKLAVQLEGGLTIRVIHTETAPPTIDITPRKD